ncbi:hypothetical protein Y032_0009g534 [Ancylostoma ceylanicum]|uniref:Cystatin domain-containing protein n=1 Tax=Ancylostoma ceylanicum TaxID=53326 RepID=A0A016VI93_9BILA|nr:hypothetical protein Y032_0009g534 [Ancylostoma ceylanicum]
MSALRHAAFAPVGAMVEGIQMKALVLLLSYFSIVSAEKLEECPGVGHKTIKGAQASEVVAQVILTKKYESYGRYTEHDVEEQLFYRPANKTSYYSVILIPNRCNVTTGIRYLVGCNLGNTCDYVVPFTITPRRKPKNMTMSSKH